MFILYYTYFGKIPVFFIEILPNGALRLSPYMLLTPRSLFFNKNISPTQLKASITVNAGCPGHLIAAFSCVGNLLCGNVAQTGFNAAWQEGAASSWSHPVVLERIALIHEVRDFAEQMPPAWIAEDLRLDPGELKGAVLCPKR